MKGVMIDSSREAMQEALTRAEEVMAIRKKDRQLTERLKTIIDHSYGGIIAVDDEGHISHFNPSAEEALRFPRIRSWAGPFKDLKEERDLQRLLADGQPLKGDLFSRSRTASISSAGCPSSWRRKTSAPWSPSRRSARFRTWKPASGKSFMMTRVSPPVSAFPTSWALPSSGKCQEEGEEVQPDGGHRPHHRRERHGQGALCPEHPPEQPRSQGPFVAINCAAIPENLLESELFGYEEGAFTGARKGGSLGLFEIAHGGTIFLDEILELPFPLQAHLLGSSRRRPSAGWGGSRSFPWTSASWRHQTRRCTRRCGKGISGRTFFPPQCFKSEHPAPAGAAGGHPGAHRTFSWKAPPAGKQEIPAFVPIPHGQAYGLLLAGERAGAGELHRKVCAADGGGSPIPIP
jgi:hypothetical protein